MQEVIAAAVHDAFLALKAASGGLPNSMVREINAVHANSTFADLPKELQASVTASVRAAFARLLKEGYSVSPGQPAQPVRSATPYRREERGSGPRRDTKPGTGRDRPDRNRRPGGDRPGPGKDAPRGGRPNPGGKPGGGRPAGGRPGGGRPGGGPKPGGGKPG